MGSTSAHGLLFSKPWERPCGFFISPWEQPVLPFFLLQAGKAGMTTSGRLALKKRTGAQIIFESLLREGVEVIFGYREVR